MASEWTSHSLTDLYEIRSGLSKPRSEFGFGYGFLTFKDVLDNYFVPETLVSLVNSTEAERTGCSIRRGDVFLTRTSETQADLGMSAVALKDYPDATFNGFTKRLRPKPDTSIVPEYAAYYFRSPKFRCEVTAMSTLSTRASLNNGMIERLTITLPAIPIQQAIGRILKSLDDKIELNRRMNRTLEKMAAAIFKSWFIDFDPVHAKAEGRDSNLPAESADLFPDTFDDSDLGQLPKHWSVGPLAELAELVTKSVKPGEEPEAIWEHYSIPAYDEGQQPHRDLGETIKSGKYAVPELAVLVSKLNPRFPRTWLPHVTDPARAICSTEFMPFVACRDHWRPFIYEMMKSYPVQDAIKAHATGSTGSRQRVKPKEIAGLSVIAPPPNVIDAFSDMTGPLHDRILLNRRQNRRLAALRDTLLPKLLSGEIELPEAEAIAEEVS